jgi:site-specific DNA recombinase
MMDKRKQAPAATKAKEVYLLTGLVTCGKCGGAMVGNRAKQGRNKEVYAFYECNTRKRLKTCDTKAINKNSLEIDVIYYLDNNLFNEKNMPKLVATLNLAHKEKNKNDILELEHAKTDLKKIEEKIGNMIKAISDGLYNPSMKIALNELEESKTNALKIISANENKAEFKLTEKMIWNYVRKDKEALSGGEPQVKKNIIASYVKSVTVFEGRIDIVCGLDFDGGGGAHTFKSKLDFKTSRNQNRPLSYNKTLVI